MSDEQVIEQEDQSSPELAAQAREMGWRPKAEFKGDDSKWVDAKTFIEHGEKVLPIVKATNKKLRDDLAANAQALAETQRALQASQESIAALERYHQEDVKQKVDVARNKLKEEIKAAKKSGDVDAEVELTDSLQKLNATENVAAARDDDALDTGRKAAKGREIDYSKDPAFIAWVEDNPWFNTDKAKTAIAHQVTFDLRQGGEKSIGRKFLDLVTDGVNDELTRLGVGTAQRKSRVEGGKGGAGGNGGGIGAGKSYADLPAEAKAACKSYVTDLVGPNRRYKSEAEWQKAYATRYFAEV